MINIFLFDNIEVFNKNIKRTLFFLLSFSYVVDVYRGNTNMFIAFFLLASIRIYQKSEGKEFTSVQLYIIAFLLSIASFKIHFSLIVFLVSLAMRKNRKVEFWKIIGSYCAFFIFTNFQWILYPTQIMDCFSNQTGFSPTLAINIFFESNQMGWLFIGIAFFLNEMEKNKDFWNFLKVKALRKLKINAVPLFFSSLALVLAIKSISAMLGGHIFKV